MLQRQTGAPTYFAADVAYQEDKFLRGFDRAIYVLGADHHGYIARLKAIASSLGEDPDRVEIPILQFVHIVEGGGRAKMSKRRGDFVTLDELIERIGVDATRWYMLSRSHDSTIDLDVELAAKQDPENPVYYVQYMHARIASILRNLDDGAARRGARRRRGDVPLNDAERELVRRLLAFPNEIREAVERRAPHRIATYALELGQAFAAFYRDSPVLKEPDEALRAFRIALVRRHPAHARRRARPARRLRPGVDVSHRPARLPAPYVHADNRGLVLCNGAQCVSIPASQLRSCAETFEIIAAEGRATAARGRTWSAATRPASDVVLYAGTQDDLVSVTVTSADFAALREAIAPPRAMRALLAAMCCCSIARRARERRGAAAHAVLAADRVAAVRARVDDRAAQAGRQARRRPSPATCSASRRWRWWTARTRTRSRCRWTR